MTIKMGSLFDGSGGFPLAASMCGITPVWASEVEPYPIAVTRSRLPGMKHLGDISKINGAEIEPVHIITFGSPCQDLSVAGKRAGLKHEANGDDETTRSGLFMEAVRIIKEMRAATNGIYPAIVLWENVPGAFSSNGGEDFRLVLQELIQISEPDAVMPAVPAKGWAYADSYSGDGWSLAYRVFDAQYWGVPQRRRRIHLVADFTGQCARQILFERPGLRGYFETGGTPWKGSATDAERGIIADDREGNDSISFGINGDIAGTLDASYHKGCGMRQGVEREVVFQPVGSFGFQLGFRPENVRVYDEVATTIVNGTRPGFCNGVIQAAGFKAGQSDDGIAYQEECAATLPANPGGVEPTVCVKERYLFENHSQDTMYKGPLDVCPMLPAQLGTGGNNTPFVVESTLLCMAHGQANAEILEDKSPTFNCNHEQPILAHGVNLRAMIEYEELYPTLQAKQTGGHSLNYSGAVRQQYIVRRLTPVECARLQGFADCWGIPDPKDDLTADEYSFWEKVCLEFEMMQGKVRLSESGVYEVWREVKPDKKKGEDFDPYWDNTGKEYQPKTKAQMLSWYSKLHTDSAEYKLWGNGIALPPALYCMQGIVDALGGAANG